MKEDVNILMELVMNGVQRLWEEVLEQEVTDHFSRDHYELRLENELHPGYRNGYETMKMKTAEGGKSSPREGDIGAIYVQGCSSFRGATSTSAIFFFNPFLTSNYFKDHHLNV